jgi:hypothetical protein
VYSSSCILLLKDTNLAVSTVGVRFAFFIKLDMISLLSRTEFTVVRFVLVVAGWNLLIPDGDLSPCRLWLEGSFSFPNLIAHPSSINLFAKCITTLSP